jgi:hypothetical protein
MRFQQRTKRLPGFLLRAQNYCAIAFIGHCTKTSFEGTPRNLQFALDAHFFALLS